MNDTGFDPAPQIAKAGKNKKSSADPELRKALARWADCADFLFRARSYNDGGPTLSEGAAFLAQQMARDGFWWNGGIRRAIDIWTIPEMAGRYGLNERTLQRRLAELVRAGLLSTRCRKAERRPSVYAWFAVNDAQYSALRDRKADHDRALRTALKNSPESGRLTTPVSHRSAVPTSDTSVVACHDTSVVSLTTPVSHTQDPKIKHSKTNPPPPDAHTHAGEGDDLGNTPSQQREGGGEGIVFSPGGGGGGEGTRPGLDQYDGRDPAAEKNIDARWSARLLAKAGVNSTANIAAMHPVWVVAAVIDIVAQEVGKHWGHQRPGRIFSRLKNETTDTLIAMIEAHQEARAIVDRYAASPGSRNSATPTLSEERAMIESSARIMIGRRLLNIEPFLRARAPEPVDDWDAAADEWAGSLIDCNDPGIIAWANEIVRRSAQAREINGREASEQAIASERRELIAHGKRLVRQKAGNRAGEVPDAACLVLAALHAAERCGAGYAPIIQHALSNEAKHEPASVEEPAARA